MSFETLWTGVSGLTAAQRQMEVAAHNVANVNTEGYSRQRVELVSSNPSTGVYGVRGDGMRGTGVTIADVVRARSGLTDAAYRSEAGIGAAADAKASVLSRAEQVLGPVDGGVPSALSAFWASWDQLSTNPTDTASRPGVLDAGAALAGQINSGAAQLSRLSDETLNQAKDTVDQVNRLADQIARLNTSISDAVVGQQSPNDLMDQRDELVDQLSALTGATVRTGDLQSADIYVGNRALVRGGTVEKLQVANTGPATVSWALDGAAATAGGQLGALVELSNSTLPGLQSELDALANGLRDQINAAHQAGKDQDGNAGLAFFTGTGAADLGVNPALDVRKVAASETGAAADGNNALAIAGLRTTPAIGTNSVQQAVEALAGHLGSLAASAKGASDASASVITNIKAERASTSSVSIDEEMADLVRFQHSYEAAAKVITVVDQCLDVLVNSTGMAGR